MEKKILEEIRRINNLMGNNPLNNLSETSNNLFVNTNTSSLILEQGYSLDVIKKMQIENLKAIIAGQRPPHQYADLMATDGKKYPSYVNVGAPAYAQQILGQLQQQQTQSNILGTGAQNLFDYSKAQYEEQNSKPGFLVDPCGWVDTSLNPDAKTEINLGTQYRNEIGYRQQDGMRATVYSDEQPIMECWDCQIFDSNSNAANCMFIPGKEIFYDEFGYFIFVDDKNQVRLYLPKDEFFTSMTNKVKSIVAYKTCNDACNAKEKGIAPSKENVYTIVYNLRYPEKALLSQTMGPNGPIFEDSGDMSRGWEINTTGVQNTGYFNFKGAYEGGEQYQFSSGVELSLEDYSEKYVKSEFDIWYDSGWGTAASIITAVVVGWAAGAYLAPSMLGFIEAQGARTLGNYAIQLAAEYAIAAPEIVYLNERGMYSQMAFVALLAHIPIVQAKWIDPKFKLDPDIPLGQASELLNRFRSGKFKTPNDLKNYLKTLDPEIRAYTEKMLKTTCDELVANPSLFRETFANQIKVVMKKATKGDLNAVTKAWEKISKTYRYKIPTASQGLLKAGKVLGVIMIPSFGINYGITELIQNSPITKDPLKLGKVQRAIETLAPRLEQNAQTQLRALLVKNESEINQAVLNQDYGSLVKSVTQQINIYEDMSKLDGASINIKTGEIKTKQEILTPFVSHFLSLLLRQVYLEQEASYAKGLAAISETQKIMQQTLSITFEEEEKKFSDFCPGLKAKQTTLKTKQEACAFRDWVLRQHKDFKHPIKFANTQYDAVLSPCSYWQQQNPKFTDDFYLSECLFLYAWEKYGNEYVKNVLTPLKNRKVPKLN